jgi:excisionase family DNA binding protein
MSTQQHPLTVDITGAADILKVHTKTVLDLINQGALPAARVGRAYVLLTKDVLNHVEQQVMRQTAARMRRPAGKSPQAVG